MYINIVAQRVQRNMGIDGTGWPYPFYFSHLKSPKTNL